MIEQYRTVMLMSRVTVVFIYFVLLLLYTFRNV